MISVGLSRYLWSRSWLASLLIQCFRHNPTHVVVSVGKVNMLSLTKSCSGFDKVQCNIDIILMLACYTVGLYT